MVERRPWTAAVLSVVHARIKEFERARDKEDFCPGYAKASASQRANCWLLLVAGISKFESNFKTGDSFVEPNGNASIGLLALSKNECPNAPTPKDLTNPIKNLLCGTNKLAMFIGRDGVIDGSQIRDGKVMPPIKPNGRVPFPGATAYWSTLKPKHRMWDPTRNRFLNLGYKAQIIPLTRIYRGKQAEAVVRDIVAFVDGAPVERVSYTHGVAEERMPEPSLIPADEFARMQFESGRELQAVSE